MLKRAEKNKTIRYLLLLISGMLSGCILQAQVFSNAMSKLDKINVYKVITLEEFVNRFNNDVGSNIRKAYKYYHTEFRINRPASVKSLFNYETQNWDSAAINDFVAEVTDAGKSRLLSLSGNFFAEAKCRFRYYKTEMDIPVILKFVTDPQKGSKWIIISIGIYPAALHNLAMPTVLDNDGTRFINPVNNEIYFTELGKVFEDKKYLSVYFDKGFFRKNRSIAFFNAILKNELEFVMVKDIQYHDLQYDNWIFSIGNFQRNTLNSGWLINNLIKTTPALKKKYLETLLGD